MIIFLSILSLFLLITTGYFGWYWFKNRLAGLKHKAYFLAKSTPLEVIHVSPDGTQWRTWKSPFDVRSLRAFSADTAAKMAELCMTPKMFDEYIEKIQAALNKKNYSEASGQLVIMKERRAWPAEAMTLRELAHCLVVLPGEDPYEATPYWFEKKMELWKKYPETERFFFHFALSTIRNLEGLSTSTLLNSLIVQEAQDALRQVKSSRSSTASESANP